VEVTFDPEVTGFHDLLEVFWSNHNPTTMNRQGRTPQQEAEAKTSRDAARARFPRPIFSEVTPATTCWPAEEYHQQYLEKRGLANCHI